MKVYLYLLIIALISFNCKKGNNNFDQAKIEFFYPNKESFNPEFQSTQISLDTIENFGKLLTIAEKIACENKEPIIKIESKNIIYNFKVFKDCLNAMDNINYKQRNIVLIQGDSIIVNVLIDKPIDSLKNVMTNHLLNNGINPNFSTSQKMALFIYHQDSTLKSKKIRAQFIKLASTFNEINDLNSDTLELKIKLNEYPFIRIPIPPFPEE